MTEEELVMVKESEEAEELEELKKELEEQRDSTLRGRRQPSRRKPA